MQSLVWPRIASPRWWPAVLAVVLSACLAQAPRTPPAEGPRPRAEARPITVPDSGVALVVQKGRRTLTVYRDGSRAGEFPVVIGRNSNGGPKRFEGDMRTPEGLYRVTEKHPHSRWRYFIGISYPNEYDVAAYAAAIADGGIPVVDGEFMGIGGAVGIHGSDRDAEQAAGFDWTMGCIALRSEDVGVLYHLVEPGTPVLILP